MNSEQDAGRASPLVGRSIVVTGGGSGVGRAIVERLALGGARVTIIDVDVNGGIDTQRCLAAHGADVHLQVADVRDQAAITAAINETVAKFGGVYGLVNNAVLNDVRTMTGDGPIEEAKPQIWRDAFDVNVVGYVRMASQVLPHMAKNGAGAIVNVASISGTTGELDRPAYGATKAAIISLTRSIATQYGRRGIRCNALALGLIGTQPVLSSAATPMRERYLRHQLLDRIVSPADVAAATEFCLSDSAAAMTGTVLTLDAGVTAHLATFADDVASP
jgi:NAD(P)-dependent dehydrogenase (short-subunit alcohol dehydrogenase family)